VILNVTQHRDGFHEYVATGTTCRFIGIIKSAIYAFLTSGDQSARKLKVEECALIPREMCKPEGFDELCKWAVEPLHNYKGRLKFNNLLAVFHWLAMERGLIVE
jgi:hypothetical protein